jgi:fatty acid synthase subunit alpha, fungi type
VSFVGMALPGDELTVQIQHISMRDGRVVVKVTTSNARGERVLEGTADVAQPTTVYIFTGRGSQEPGMGMDLYNNSPAARVVWDGADAHLINVYGFSIIEIVKENPKQKTIHFSGIKGQPIHQRYIDMHYDITDSKPSQRYSVCNAVCSDHFSSRLLYLYMLIMLTHLEFKA